MRPYLASAAVCAAVLTLTAPARAEDEVPQPESRTVVEPPAQPPPAAAQPTAAPAPRPVRPRSEIGFTLRMGAAETERFLFGGSFAGASGPLMVGVSADGTFDVRGSGRRRHDWDEDDDHGWCEVRSNGRCTSRADFAMSGLVGLRQKTGPVFGGARLRLEVAGELGWQWSFVSERVVDGYGDAIWSDGVRAFPIAGVRGQVGLTVFRNATFGLGAYARQGLRGRVCVNTDGGCTKVGGTTAGVYFFGGGDWGVGG